MTGASDRPRRDAPTVVRAVGLISGTSMDGIDAAAVEIADGVPLRAELRAYLTLPYPAEIRAALREVCRAGEGTLLRWRRQGAARTGAGRPACRGDP